jgi:Glycosyl hydrolases family 2, TIM barrel domain/Glycosyl hydrolases family 2, sugar binding domain
MATTQGTGGARPPAAFGADVMTFDGRWDFFVGGGDLADLADHEPAAITVPGLWEAQGFLELDGMAWYRRQFTLDDPDGWWTLRFGAVMDLAQVYLNGRHLGGHDNPFTPFELDPSAALVAGHNELAVRVADPPAGSPQHTRTAHGKQGWANDVFPSPPSLYLTYGGIWQPVTLRRHGPVAVRDVFVNGDPEDLVAAVELHNCAATAVLAEVVLRTPELRARETVDLEAGARRTLEIGLGPTGAPRWTPDAPVLHDLRVEVAAAGGVSDRRSLRYGLRTVRLDGTRLLLNGEPYRMKSALVQGFWSKGLYAEDGREAIRAEVEAAKAMGLNTLRLHIKAFDPAYLDVCDELGMLLHCDIPVAEPIAHEELGADTVLARRCVAAATEQVRRDRNHPSVVLWSAMNELCLECVPARAGDGYEGFARTMVAAIGRADPTRPIIENDWVEPDPERVFVSPLLTAHWYGRLQREYLEHLEAESARWAGIGRPLLITEFGDWGLPDLPLREAPPFWHQGDGIARDLAGTPWPGTPAEFVAGTQRYQGLADRLQAEVFRRHDHLGGYCVTELTDVPHELNGLLDFERRPKPAAVAELARVNQPVLPMLELTGFTTVAGGAVRAPLHVANDEPALRDVTIEALLGDARVTVAPGDLPGHRAVRLAEVELSAPARPGTYELVLRLWAASRLVADNGYPVQVVAAPAVAAGVRLVGSDATATALTRLGTRIDGDGPLVIGEGALHAGSGAAVRAHLDRGGSVLVLAQEADAAVHYPVPVTLQPVAIGWGSSVFHFTTGQAELPSLPARAVLATEDMTVKPTSYLTRLGDRTWPPTVSVGAWKPPPFPLQGTVVGGLRVGPGRLLVCQFRLADAAAAGDPAALALLADLLRWATRP